MSSNVASEINGTHHNSLDGVAPRMAKVGLARLKNLEQDRYRKQFGQILRRAVELGGLIDKEAADQLGVDPAQLSRWYSGAENAQCWRFHAHETLGPCLLAAMAEETPGATIRQVIELQRKVG